MSICDLEFFSPYSTFINYSVSIQKLLNSRPTVVTITYRQCLPLVDQFRVSYCYYIYKMRMNELNFLHHGSLCHIYRVAYMSVSNFFGLYKWWNLTFLLDPKFSCYRASFEGNRCLKLYRYEQVKVIQSSEVSNLTIIILKNRRTHSLCIPIIIINWIGLIKMFNVFNLHVIVLVS